MKLTLISDEQCRSDSWWWGSEMVMVQDKRKSVRKWLECLWYHTESSKCRASRGKSRGKVTESSNPRASWMRPPLWLSLRCPTLGTFHMLSQTLQPLLHALPLILYHHNLASSSSRVTSTLLIAYQSKFCHKLVVIASRISTIQRRTNE